MFPRVITDFFPSSPLLVDMADGNRQKRCSLDPTGTSTRPALSVAASAITVPPVSSGTRSRARSAEASGTPPPSAAIATETPAGLLGSTSRSVGSRNKMLRRFGPTPKRKQRQPKSPKQRMGAHKQAAKQMKDSVEAHFGPGCRHMNIKWRNGRWEVKLTMLQARAVSQPPALPPKWFVLRERADKEMGLFVAEQCRILAGGVAAEYVGEDVLNLAGRHRSKYLMSKWRGGTDSYTKSAERCEREDKVVGWIDAESKEHSSFARYINTGGEDTINCEYYQQRPDGGKKAEGKFLWVTTTLEQGAEVLGDYQYKSYARKVSGRLRYQGRYYGG